MPGTVADPITVDQTEKKLKQQFNKRTPTGGYGTGEMLNTSDDHSGFEVIIEDIPYCSENVYGYEVRNNRKMWF